MTRGVPFVKGHGTENDFVLLPDPDGTRHADLDAGTVRRLTDRYTGVGGDGVIRVVRSRDLTAGQDIAAEAEWFMDYRNADGSVAEMCGNGVRVIARYLWATGLATGQELAIGTRGGVRMVRQQPDGSVTAEMGRPQHVRPAVPVQVAVGDGAWPAEAVFVPNPHAVVFVDALDDAGRLLEPPTVTPESVFPDGANVEFVVGRGDRHIALRVWERGVGETRSCGTGVCAAAWAAMRRDDAAPGTSCTVDVPGGRLVVTERADGVLLLTGPAVLGLAGQITLPM
ncbi:MAG TPA: diaminopimelate epimerase [Jiangellaceae bacterium]|nr:diaminopimelate epimerase [Jiangellaceae bacterium]